MRHALLALAIAGCGHAAAIPQPPVAPAPGLRLGNDVVPRRVALDLTIRPDLEDYGGSVAIDVDLRVPTRTIWLHARGLTVDGAEVEAGGATVRAALAPLPAGDDRHLGLVVERALGPGPATLRIRYRGKMNAANRGVFRKPADGAMYVYTYMEAPYAREAFPCFDEPGFKVPWRLTLHVPRDLVAAANGPVESETPDGELKTVRFAETPPLPSYLVAFTVGPFDAVDAGRTSGGAPIRVLVPRGRGADAAWPVAATRPVLAELERYFGVPYPYAKLDWVSMPSVTLAEENAGLITAGEMWLLARPETDSERRRRTAGREIFAHELAHMWFGDMVTTAWWDDTWLNEGFATWMSTRVTEAWQPTWHTELDAIGRPIQAIESDSLASARAIRQPIASENDIDNAFDTITYYKGAAVLGMFESWVGPERFQAGIRAHLRAHANGSATSAQLFAALDAATGKDLSRVMATFTDQAGVPRVSAELQCAPGARPVVILAQERHLVAGSAGEPRSWSIPVCLHAHGPGGDARTCTLLETRQAELALDGPCPDWVYPNAGGLGYYVSAPRGRLLAALLAHVAELPLGERYRLLADMVESVDAGVQPVGEVLAALPAFRPASEPHLARLALAFLDQVRREMMPERLAPAHAALVRTLFAARTRELGVTPRPGEDFDAAALRPLVILAVATAGADPALAAEVRRLALAWLDDPRAVDASLAQSVLYAAAWDADRALFERLRTAAVTLRDDTQRRWVLFALGAVRDPALVDEALAFVLDATRDPQESIAVFSRLVDGIATGPRVYAWTKTHFDALAARFPAPYRTYFLNAGARTCDDAGIADYQTFFHDKAQAMEGGPREFDQRIETMRSCVALRRAHEASAAAFFAKR